jgi:hypothetical protein
MPVDDIFSPVGVYCLVKSLEPKNDTCQNHHILGPSIKLYIKILAINAIYNFILLRSFYLKLFK